ncbi:hypothetical protein A2331_00590 [Candidatus Falkowbacteria bacterium RIFOXYB2_FULL_34_18]|uniref:Uncharacterized protein n=1 Tax=Candidatus Falkowbacteria bacterium RIFOXYD2_FULL_34_120 TaxID=1798007 RepID=A0A1F5TLW4_9BACT|nr:MAG: hypothetical protein A2331_00590 [Candidatus Falkowbacteria bacterium RIFOXYB2_FULL_34_18]OGF29189.1 MAG: hypothetical protein A2500_05905 [Candidatus Falkowbacteria bacterium RIFOXYC12_FULL_34_55]OGF37727.1 MAG: hypothetical protein A2466_06235 [Candidatus Falkowbacteria bacterium RIFOXYC2_FULL_34_220]OGF38711.1 MAG: hypothetical protein A2515_01570 [Candidatus Falkowbacteria bacterium RIFOXYD12_FULL_34_57]OGF39945.1 MAG: hypothetical protein A2531_01825 [Candidatus Falkowbacteria bact
MCTEYKEISLALKGKIPFSDKVEISCECGKNFTGKLKQNLPLLDCPECLRRYQFYQEEKKYKIKIHRRLTDNEQFEAECAEGLHK